MLLTNLLFTYNSYSQSFSYILIMAKSRMTKDCFIEINGKASFKSALKSNNVNDEDDESPTLANIKDMSSVTKNKIIREMSSSNSDSSEILGSQKPQERESESITADDDDKSDYGAESFCSDDSCKGSEVTNVTARSSLSGCSSLLHSTELKYDKRITDLMKSRRSGDRRTDEEEDGEGFSLLESEMKCLGEEDALTIDRRQLTRSGRRNMSFTNEELRKIERDNQLLLKRIMSHQKPQNKPVKPVSGAPRTSSSAINRKRQQKKIEEDNMILLRRIQQAKPCAMPKTSAPNCRLATI